MSSLSTLPKGDSAWLLRKSIQRIMQQVSVLETNIGSSTTGNSANTQVIFNDNGTLRGDTGLTFNKTTDTLGTGRLTTSGDAIVCSSTGDFYVGSTVTPQFKVERATGSATITGDLTVDTSTLKVDSANNRVGIGTASPTQALHVRGNILTGSAAGTDSFLNVTTDGVQNSLFGFNNSGSTNGYGASNNNTYVGSGNNYGLQIIGNSSVLASFSTSGVFNWYDGAGGTRMTLNSTGLGVGASPSYKIHALSTVPDVARFERSGAGGAARIQLVNGSGTVWYFRNGVNDLVFNYEGTDLVTFGSTGNVGIGVTPSVQIGNYKSLQIGIGGNLIGRTDDAGIELSSNAYRSGSGSYIYLNTDNSASYRQYSGTHQWFTAPSGTAGNAITFTQAMTLDASGKLNLGVASPYNAARLTVQSAGGAGGISVAIQNDDDSYYAINFRNSSGTSCGSISCTTSSTSFNVSSDYRLKEAVQPLTGGLTRVNALKPSIYKWKVNGSTGEGFIAHELADVVPFAVTGDKDAVDADGKPSYQGVDLSKLVPILVAAIQELTARVQTLEAK